ncbi:hypothetical protein B0J14DRAFT_587589, partial [Halenospora varia]
AGTVKPDEVVLSDFAALADRLGFQSDQISALKQRSSDREIARAALLNARKLDRYEYADHDLESHVEQIVRLFATATPLSVEQLCPAFVGNDPTALRIRCGFPDNEVHARDAKFLTIANLHVDVDEQGKDITPFFVRRSVYFAFFGWPSETTSRSRPSPPQDSDIEETGSSSLFQESRSNPAPDTGAGLHGDLEQGRLGTLGGERHALDRERLAGFEQATWVRVEQDNREQERLEPNSLESEGQASVDDDNHVQEDIDSSQPTERDQRRADGLASITDREDRPQSSRPAVDLEELVDSYQDLISTDRQQYEQTPDRQLQMLSPPLSMVRIEFKINERNVWRTDRSLLVDPSDPSEVERVAKKYMRKGIRPFDSSFNLLVPRTCFQAATADGSNAILLIPENNMEVDNQLVVFVPNAMPETELPDGARQKRGRH